MDCNRPILPPPKPMKLDFPSMKSKSALRKTYPVQKKPIIFSNEDCNDNVGRKSDAEILSMLSPSSVFQTSKLPESTQQLIQGVVLSCWDNILGPKVHHVWTNENLETFRPAVLSRVSSHTLNGEICRDTSDSSIDVKFYHMTDISFIVTAFIFTATVNSRKAIHSLAVILPEKCLQQYLPFHFLCVDFMVRHISKLRILLAVDSEDSAVNDFSLYIHDLVELLNSLDISGLPFTINNCDTAFDPEHKFEDAFLRKAIASHLMTCGHSVVVGNVPSRINLLLSTLGLFLSPQERQLSRSVKEDQGWNYSPHLVIQGLLMGENKKVKLFVSEVLNSRYPSTIIDIPKREVFQTPPCHEHNIHRYEMLKTELTSVWLQQKEPASGLYPTSAIFQHVDFRESLVSNFIKELWQLHPSCGVREEYVEQFMRQLERKALALIKYVEFETQEGKLPFKTNMKKLRLYLSVPEDGDFRIVLSTAERLKPGMHSVIYGETRVQN